MKKTKTTLFSEAATRVASIKADAERIKDILRDLAELGAIGENQATMADPHLDKVAGSMDTVERIVEQLSIFSEVMR